MKAEAWEKQLLKYSDGSTAWDMLADMKSKDAEIFKLIGEREKLVLTLGHAYLVISRLVADPPHDDTRVLTELLTTIDAAVERKHAE